MLCSFELIFYLKEKIQDRLPVDFDASENND